MNKFKLNFKENKFLISSLVITLILFIIPFFWLKHGEMDIGGDSSRLYFYDPIAYLKTQILYGVITSGTGGEAASYFVLPFILLLAAIKYIVHSPTILIAIVNGAKLSFGYFTFYLILKELIGRKNNFTRFSIEVSSILASLFYLLAPPLIYSGWERSILSHIQIFINPLVFLVLLKYLNSRKTIYLVIVLLITFVFSSSFSYFAAPALFSFFPLTLLFLYFYTTHIQLRPFPFKVFIKCVALFILLQIFHLGPHMLSLFTANSDINKSVFAVNTIYNLGLDYFIATAANIKVSISLFALAQLRDITLISFSYILFPLIIIIGLFRSKSKLLLITGIFFLIAFFFVTANITETGFTFYKLLFRIPGFKMFRNFYGQWVFVFMFFYALLFGQSLMTIINLIKQKYSIFLVLSILTILVNSSFPLLSGSITQSINNQSKNVKQSIIMDPIYEKFINYVRDLPIDGKILSFPLTGPGYQLFAGKRGGAYMGPSTFSYLAGKDDFTGYAGLGTYGQEFIEKTRDKDFDAVANMMSLLNIKYLFYNADPYIYDDNFPSYPYDFVRDYMPKTQEGYKNLISDIAVWENVVMKQGFYNLYSINNKNYLPHIYTTSNLLYTSNPDVIVLNSNLNPDVRTAIFNINDANNKSENVILEGNSDNPLEILQNNYHLHHHEPFISVDLNDYLYPLVLIKEKFQLWRNKNNHDRYLDFSLYFLTKRILELQRWGEKLPVNMSPVVPRMLDVSNVGRYYSWEASLSRYEAEFQKFITWINMNKLSDNLLITDKIKISEQLYQHKNILHNLLLKSKKKDSEVRYLQGNINDMYFRLYKSLNLNQYDPTIFSYNLAIPNSYINDTFDVYIQYPHAELSLSLSSRQKKVQLDIDGQHLDQIIDVGSTQLQKIHTVTFKKSGLVPFRVIIPTSELNSQDNNWTSSGNFTNEGNNFTLNLLNIPGDNSGGIIKQIKNWSPNKQYVITFDYNTHGADIMFRLFDKVFANGNLHDIHQHIYSDRALSAGGWSTNQLIVTSDANSLSGYLQFLNNSLDTNVVIDIRNLSVVEINYPEIFFVKKSNINRTNFSIPTIKFTKINPTKYQVDVTNATNPYILIFLEAYSNQWKLIDISRNGAGWTAGFMRIFGLIFSDVAKISGKRSTDNNFVAVDYFDGKVKEGKHINSFLDVRNFSSWGKTTIAEHNHFKVNGYANSWIIYPTDVQNRATYTITLEMKSQNYFYIYLSISCVTLIAICTYGVYWMFNNSK